MWYFLVLCLQRRLFYYSEISLLKYNTGKDVTAIAHLLTPREDIPWWFLSPAGKAERYSSCLVASEFMSSGAGVMMTTEDITEQI